MIHELLEDPDRYMQTAWTVAKHSQDPSTQLGALLVPASGIGYVQGFNHLPLGMDPSVWHDRERKYAAVIHAEESAILNAARAGISTEGSAMVCPWACCSRCAGIILAAGVKALFYDNAAWDRCPARWLRSVEQGHQILRDAGVIVEGITMSLPKPETLFDGERW